MGATNLHDKTLRYFLQQIRTDYPNVRIENSEKSYWDPVEQIIYFNPDQQNPIWSLLHEVGHMKRGHSKYSLDIELLIMETEAWQSAKELSAKYDIELDNDYIEDCLDSYRDWLHKRSMCPRCKQTGVQSNQLLYTCLNCGSKWKVSISRFCRSYRMQI